YTVVSDPDGINTGSVTISVYTVNDVTGTIATDGTPVTEALNTPGQNGRLTFSGTAGQRVSVVGRGTLNDCWWTMALLDPNGSTLASTHLCSTLFFDTLSLPTTGTYTVVSD